MATQTLIQLKYSSANSAPSTLSQSEPAYSFVSNKLFIGTGSTVVAIGGQFYTGLIDANTSYATPGTIVVRDGEGSSQFNGLLANTISANSTIFAGLADASPLPGATNPLIGASGNDNNYIQNYIRNINAGDSASADFVAYPDNGSDVSGWIDMGITSSTYDDGNFAVTGPNEGYLFMSATNGSGMSGNLVIATDSTGVYNSIVFQTGGFTDIHTAAHFEHNQGFVIDATTASYGNNTGALVVNGGAGIKGALYADEVYDGGSRVLSSASVNSGAGISVSTSISGNTETITINNTGVQSLTANSGETTVSDSTGNLTFGLANTAVTAGTYGGASQVPTIIVDEKGRVTYAGNSTISTSWSLSANTGTTDTINGGETLTIVGNGSGITTTVTNNQLTLGTNDTVLRSNTSGIGPQTISTDLTVTGNLVIRGTSTTVNTQIVQTDDSMILLAANNTVGDVIDSGFVSTYNDGASQLYSGVMRHAANKDYYIYKDYDQNPTANIVNINDASFKLANVHSDIAYVNVVKNSDIIDIISNGYSTRFNTNGTITPSGALVGGNYSGNQIDVSLVGFGTQVKGVYEGVDIIVSADGSGANTSHFYPNGTVSLFGEVTSAGINLNTYTQSAFNKANSAATSSTTLTSGAILVGDGSNNISTLANTTFTATGSLTTANTISSITVDAYGRLTALTSSKIAISADAITSGTLSVTSGGTSSSSFSANGVVISSTTTTGALTAVTGSAYQVLQLSASGIPVFGGLNGGTF